MLTFLRRLLHPSKASDALVAPKDVDALIGALGAKPVVMLGSLTQDGLPLETLSEEVLLAASRNAAENLSSREMFSSFRYEDERTLRLPFFTSKEAADAFCGAYCDREGRAFQFQAFFTDARRLATWATPGTCVIMNPQTDGELLLSEEALSALRSTWNPSGASGDQDLSTVPRSSRILVVPAPIGEDGASKAG